MIIILIGAVIFGFISGVIAENKGIGFWSYFWVGFILGPIGLVVTLVSKGAVCPYCKKSVHPDASICPYCRKPLIPVNSVKKPVVTKVQCPYCDQTIPSSAIVCPYCRKSLK